MPRVRVLDRWCKGCGLCVDACPAKVFHLAETPSARGIYLAIAGKPSACTGCRACVLLCPDAAIELPESIAGEAAAEA